MDYFNSFFIKDKKKHFVALSNDLLMEIWRENQKNKIKMFDVDEFIEGVDTNQEFALIQLAYDRKIESKDYKRCFVMIKLQDSLQPISLEIDVSLDLWAKGWILNDSADIIGNIGDFEEIRGKHG